MKYNDFDVMPFINIGTGLATSLLNNKATTTAANATTSAANANLQAQQIAQQNLQNQLLIAQRAAQSQSQPATNNNKTLLWVSIGVGAAILVTVIIVVLAKRK